jgi:outer membrane murein-binding lipoprotein Lpp
MKTTNLKTALFFILSATILAGCSSPSNLIDRGHYEDAISISVRKLSGKKNKNPKHVEALETAFEKATREDMRKIEVLKNEGRSENWVEINKIHQRIRKRQELIEPLLPLTDKNGNKAAFKFVKIEDMEIESKNKAADFHYSEGRRLLQQAEKGDKEAARQAWEEFNSIKRYYKNFKDEEQLMKKAQELGTNYVLFRIENASGSVLPPGFEQELKRISVRDMESRWRSIHLNSEAGIDYDFTALMKITSIAVTPDLVKEREYIDDKTIEEGFEYVLDSKGNVMKDTAGNDIKVPKKVLIKAKVFETYQHKVAQVDARLDIFDNAVRELIHTEPVNVDAVFENYAATFSGDKRALSDESNKKIGNRPLPFPSSEALILQSAELMKPIIKSKIANNRLIR